MLHEFHHSVLEQHLPTGHLLPDWHVLVWHQQVKICHKYVPVRLTGKKSTICIYLTFIDKSAICTCMISISKSLQVKWKDVIFVESSDVACDYCIKAKHATSIYKKLKIHN